MAAFSSPLRLIPPMTPRRAPSPTMSPGGRRGRTHGSSEEGRLRDLSPETTLRAFTQKPMPFDTTRDEYKIFSCIESLTAAERDLGARVAKAAQRLKSWCTEIEQWGWSGSFEQPSEQYREERRRSIELRIREHVAATDPTGTLPPLEYWGSLLSVEVEQHEARLDDMEDEMLKLDVEELKEHVLDMHPAGRSRPSSSGYEANRHSYRLMDDFSFLITQTLLCALPHHAQLKERLNTWTARVTILRAAPRFASELDTAQKAMRLGWDAIDPPLDTSDMAFAQWKEAVDTISGVLHSKVADLGQLLDHMLDTLESREDCLPENWIDTFESTEADYGRWAHESRRRVIELDVRRKGPKGPEHLAHEFSERHEPLSAHTASSTSHLRSVAEAKLSQTTTSNPTSAPLEGLIAATTGFSTSIADGAKPKISSDGNVAAVGMLSITAHEPDRVNVPGSLPAFAINPIHPHTGSVRNSTPRQSALGTPRANLPGTELTSPNTSDLHKSTSGASRSGLSSIGNSLSVGHTLYDAYHVSDDTPIPRIDLGTKTLNRSSEPSDSFQGVMPSAAIYGLDAQSEEDDESDFDEGDTVVHNELDTSPDHTFPVQSLSDIRPDSQEAVPQKQSVLASQRPRPFALSDFPAITTTDGHHSAVVEPPQTPRSRKGSVSSQSSETSFESTPPGNIDDSPSVRNVVNRALRMPRPELNAAMAKRRPAKSIVDESVVSMPWPPTRFTQKPANSADDLERKISDILTTIPAHIRLTSGPGADAPEVKSTRSVAAKGSRNYLRAARSVSGLKSPELTLSPAKNDDGHVASGRKSAATSRVDNDIKLYHLTQPGKEQPVKLFIRRVGDNGERVMVRVGGGWADLGEYLRQYAEHHGRRTASDGKFEILGLEVKGPDSSPNRPESGLAKRDRRFSGGHGPASPTTTTPSRPSALAMSTSEASPRMPSFTSTPGAAEETSIPSTNSSQRSWQGNEVGLAGPRSKKLDLSGQKLEWFEGMMKQARTVSGNIITANQAPFQRDELADGRGEGRPDSRTSNLAGTKKPEFGDLGKIGGTKRIFLKGGKPVGGEQ